jgi:aminomethyltransferase
MTENFKITSLNKTHRNQGAKMVEFAGYDMPVQYPEGMLKEHEWTRGGNVGIFDVSHMGQFYIEGENVDKFLSQITPTDFSLSTNFLAKYTVLTNENGGIIDDLIITKINDKKFFIVLNAGCKEKDANWIKKNLPANLKFVELANRSLIAIQGSKAQEVLLQIIPNANLAELAYMHLGYFKYHNHEIMISRTGYTGEDGFEISIENEIVEDFWLKLCENKIVKPIGLGARDSLRLEMGYPLYGHDLSDETSPIEAGIGWVISKTNLDFIGSKKILPQKTSGVSKKRMGVKLLDRGIAREGCEVRKSGKKIGILSSGGFSPTLKISIGQGYFDPQLVKIGDEVSVVIRDREVLAQINSFNFVEAKTKAVKK